jgi:hypothetical protein
VNMIEMTETHCDQRRSWKRNILWSLVMSMFFSSGCATRNIVLPLSEDTRVRCGTVEVQVQQHPSVFDCHKGELLDILFDESWPYGLSGVSSATVAGGRLSMAGVAFGSILAGASSTWVLMFAPLNEARKAQQKLQSMYALRTEETSGFLRRVFMDHMGNSGSELHLVDSNVNHVATSSRVDHVLVTVDSVQFESTGIGGLFPHNLDSIEVLVTVKLCLVSSTGELLQDVSFSDRTSRNPGSNIIEWADKNAQLFRSEHWHPTDFPFAMKER